MTKFSINFMYKNSLQIQTENRNEREDTLKKMSSSKSQHATVEKKTQQKCRLLDNKCLVFELDEGESCRRVQKEEPSLFSHPAVAISQQSMLRDWFDRRGGGVGDPCRCVTRRTSVFLRLNDGNGDPNRTIAFDGDKFKI